MRVLGAVLRAQSKVGRAVTFKELKSQLEGDESGNTVVDSLIYRLLTQLEKECFINVDRSQYRHTYSSGFANIHTGLESASREAVKNIEEDISKIELEMESLSNIDISDFVRSTLKLLTGRKHKIKSESALGKEGFESLLSDKIFSDCAGHDLIRIAMNSFTKDNDIQSALVKFLHTHSQTRFKIKVLFKQSLTENQTKHAIEQLMKIKSSGCDVSFHICNELSNMQSFISRNTDGVLLIPTGNPHVSVWIPRILNSRFVKDTIASFDTEFSHGCDIMKVVNL
jgi:hypothetical protein